MTTSAQTHNATIVATGNVEGDVPCRKCAYNLRGLPVAGRCPEYGTPVGISVHGDLLRYSDPQFVETLRRGISFILWGILALFVASVLAGILSAALRRSVGGSLVIQFVALVGYLPLLIGGWLLTVPDPSGVGEDSYGTPRKIIRFSLAVGLVNHLINIAIGVGPVAPVVLLALRSVSFAAAMVGLVGEFAQLYYLRRLALRIPDADLSERARFLMWAFGISYGLFLVIGFVGVLAAAAGGGGGIYAFACFGGIVFIAVIVFAVMYLFMLARFGRQFKEQGALARQFWSGTGQNPPAGSLPA